MDKNLKDYQDISEWGNNIDIAVEELLKFKNQGKLAYIKFNGHILYSDTVTLDGAYLQITGKTKQQKDKEYKEWKEDYDKKENEFKEKIPSLVDKYIEKGKQILTKDKWESWAEIVPIRLSDLYHGMELDCCLNIIKLLNNGETLELAKKEIESQEHSGMSFSLVCSMILAFCNRGQEFFNYIK